MTVSEEQMTLRVSTPYNPTALWVPNLALLVIIVMVFLGTTCGEGRVVETLVLTDDATRSRIVQLERRLRYGAPDAPAAGVELASLYLRVGAFPWAYDALKQAESRAPRDPGWRLDLGLAYIEIGHNDDGLRVISEAYRSCNPPQCGSQVRARLSLYLRVAELMKERRIDARRDLRRANEVFREVLKPAEATGLMPKPAASRPADSPAAGN
jgi:hypothetical protein